MLALQLIGSADDSDLMVGETEAPADEAGRVVVDVAFAGITATEPHWSTNWQADGSPRSRPVVLGLEFSGRVRSIGARVGGFTVGQRVLGMTEPSRGGAFAEMVSAPASQMLAVPERMSDEDASVLPLAGATAWQAIVRYGELQRGQRVLIHGGAGGVGAFATQLAARIGAHVTVTASARDAALCRRLGADDIVDYSSERFETRADAFDLVFDQIGGDVLERSWAVVKPGGRLITIAGETVPDQERANALGITARYFVVDSNLDELQSLVDLVADGTVQAVVGGTFALASATDAFDGHFKGYPGKAVVRCRRNG